MIGHHKSRFPYFKFYPRDWLEATRTMSLEQRGAYIDLICILMEMEGHLRDDDRWISHHMHISARKWRAVKSDLVERKKIRVEGGLIIQERCLKELDLLMNRSRTNSESASNRERTKRENHEKPNEINDAHTTVAPPRARVLLDSEEERKNPPIVPHAGDAPTKAADRPIKKRGRTAVPEVYSESFGHFWNLYPRREGKASAAKSWDHLTLEQQRRAYDALRRQLSILEMRAKDSRGNFCPLPATWLNQGRFDDEPRAATPAVQPSYSMNGNYIGALL